MFCPVPTYEYICDNEHLFIEVRSIHDDQIQTTCPEDKCNLPLKRKFTATPTILKGSGFASTDIQSNLLKRGQQVDY